MAIQTFADQSIKNIFKYFASIPGTSLGHVDNNNCYKPKGEPFDVASALEIFNSTQTIGGSLYLRLYYLMSCI